MNINVWSPSVLALIAGAIVLISTLVFGKQKSSRKMWGWIGGVLAVVGVLVLLMGANLPTGLAFLNAPLWTGFGKTSTIGGTTITYSAVPGQGTGQVSVNSYQPTALYTTIDKFSTLSVPGTSYYKVNANRATQTAYANVNAGDLVTYWVDNSTYYVMPKTITTTSGPNTVQADAYSNGSLSVSAYDIVQDKVLTNSVNNASMTANANAKIKLTVIGSAKTSNVPFGGVMVVEFNSTIPTASCSGDGIVGLNSKYQVTYTPTTINSRYLIYEVANGFDVSKDGGNTGVTNVIRCDFTNGATATSGSAYSVKFIPANWYVTNDGRIVLDVEKSANGATTRTNIGGSTTQLFWG